MADTFTIDPAHTAVLSMDCQAGIVSIYTREAKDAADADYRVAVIGDCCADLDSTLHDCLIQRFFPTRGSVLSSEGFVVASSTTDKQS
jgi:Isochorismatase family